jgi:drug/metabolite transporter (DMT)-like permease
LAHPPSNSKNLSRPQFAREYVRGCTGALAEFSACAANPPHPPPLARVKPSDHITTKTAATTAAPTRASAPVSAAAHRRGVVLMLVSAAAFTANVLLIRALGQVQSVNVWLITCTRFAVGLALIYALYRREFRPGHLFRHPKLATRGLLGGISVYGYYLTVVHLGAGRATFINNTYVIFGALMAAWILGERFRPALAFGGVAALVGLALLTNAFGAGAHANPYDLLAVLVALTSAYIVITIRQLHATEHTSTIFGAQCVYGLLICGLPAALHPEPVSLTAWAVMLTAGVFAGIGQLAMTRSFRDLSVAEGSLLQMVVPLGIAAGGAVFFAEHFAVHELVGAALILAGTAFTALRR